MENVNIKTIMTSEPIVLGPNDCVTKVEEIFETNNIHHIPVIDDNKKVLGIVSKTDFLMACQSLTFYNKDFKNEKNQRLFRSLLVEELMTKDVAKVNEDQSLMFAAGIFKENLFHALPVVNKNNELVGIITTFDLIGYAYKERAPQIY